MEEKKKIVLVDDHIIVRNGLKELIEKTGPYVISDQFDSGDDLLENLAAIENTDLIILDVNMPGLRGDKTAQRLHELKFPVPVLMLTLNSDEKLIIRLFRAGVRGFLKKDCSASELGGALEAIFKFGYFYNEHLALSLSNPGTGEEAEEEDRVIKQLTNRERDFLKLVCDENEYTYDQIAAKMGVSIRTVDGYRESVFEKFDIKSKTGLVLFVLKNRLFDIL